MYFKNFPRLLLDSGTGATSGAKIAVDVLRRVGFNSQGQTGSEYFVQYDIKDYETPETVADSLYGSPEYHWVVLMFNDILNPLFEWPLSTRKFEKKLKNKYNGVTLFIDEGASGPSGTFSRNDTLIQTSLSGGAAGLTGFKSLVSEYDPTLHKIVVTDIDLTYSFSEGDEVKAFNSAGGTGWDDYVGSALVKRVVTDSKQALHHFETSGSVTGGYDDMGGGTGTSVVWLDPLSKYDGITQHSLGSGGTTYGNTLLYGYIYNDSTSYVKTNYQYEDELNETNRSISLLDPQYLPHVLDEFKQLIRQ